MYLHRKRRDANHAGLKALAERIGASWLDTCQLGDDAPDALVGFQGFDVLIEIKPPGKLPEPGQIVFAKTWMGRAIVLVRTGDDLMGALLGPAYGKPANVADVVLPEKRKGVRRATKN